MTDTIDRIRHLGEIVRPSRAIASGIRAEAFYRLRDEGALVEISRGVYRLADLPMIDHPDLIAVAVRVPKAVVCLVSALAFHEATTQVPHAVDIALPQGVKTPRIGNPPIRTFHVSPQTYDAGVEDHLLDGVPVRIYSMEKTIADCFKFRNRVGSETAVEALRLGLERKGASVSKILQFARICRVESIMRPYLEALT